MDIEKKRHIFFASDFHLGLPEKAGSLQREKCIVRWLDSIAPVATNLFLVGDLFDVWFEYKRVVPKGYVRFLGKLAEMSDANIHIEAFTGNHDLWMKGYFEEELNIPVHHGVIKRTWNDKTFVIGHGDGLGPNDLGYKFLKKILRNPVSQWLYRRIHPDTGIGMASWFSKLGPKHDDMNDKPFLGPEKEWLVQYALQYLQREPVDYFIFGHRHLALHYPLTPDSTYINLGDWLQFNSYAEFDGDTTELKFFEKTKSVLTT